MYRSILTLAAVLAVAATGAASAATPTFGKNVCSLLSAKQVTAIPGLSPRCTNVAPARGPGSTIYVGRWAAAGGTSPSLQVTVSQYKDPGLLRLAQRNLGQGLVATPHKLRGVGAAAYEATGGVAAEVQFTSGAFVVGVTLTAHGKAPSPAAVEQLAKAIVPRL